MSVPHMRHGVNDPLNQLIKDWLLEKKDLVGIQIGSYAGESTELFTKSNVFKIFYAIDPWIMNYDPHDGTGNSNLPLAEQEFDKRFKDNLIVKKIKLKSNEAVTQFKDNSIDFIYIDGCHTYESVKQDLQLYVPKIKVGGIIAGHDYGGTGHIAGVKIAVDEYFKTTPLKTYSDRSWVYIKN